VTRRPLVGIVCGRSPEARYSAHRGYVASVSAAGGVPVLVPAGPDADPDFAAAAVRHCDALVVTGGGDIDPSRYGASRASSSAVLMDVDPRRDAAEVAAVAAALSGGKRVLGVCRGAQLLAVMGGGTLIADLAEKGIDGHWEEERQYEPVHRVQAEAGSLAGRIVAAVADVNSIHHQAIADPGQELRATAWSPDGVVEAVEGTDRLGVQWHPERLAPRDPAFLAPFRWVVDR